MNHDKHQSIRAARLRRWVGFAGLLALSVMVNAQQAAFLPPATEEEAHSLFSAKGWLETPALPSTFVFIQHTPISRIVTLHRKPAPEQLPILLTLVNKTGDFRIGEWEAQIQEIPNAPNLVYCIFEVGKSAPPGRYEANVSAPDTWINSPETSQKGMIWVLMKKQSAL